MLPENALVKVRAALEKGYAGTFTVTEHHKITKANHTTAFEDVVTLEDQPCRLSFSSSPAAGSGTTAALDQSVKLFFAPEISIKEGSKITVTQNGKTTDYKQSGTTALYDTHAEIQLELFRGWA